jgi:hypothetical protein
MRRLVARLSLTLLVAAVAALAPARAEAQGGSWLLRGCAVYRPSCFDVAFSGAPSVDVFGNPVLRLSWPFGVTEGCVAADPSTCWRTVTSYSRLITTDALGRSVSMRDLLSLMVPYYAPLDWVPVTGQLSIIACCDANGDGANVGHVGEVVELTLVPEPATWWLAATGLVALAAFRTRRRLARVPAVRRAPVRGPGR